MKKAFTLSLVLGMSVMLSAQTGPYWATDVAPILFSNCTGCHNPNGIASFSLLTYGDAFTNATYIADEVQNRRMPPWPPDSSYSRFCDERLLSQQEIQTIVDWVNNGAPSGNLSQAPPAPTYSGAAVLSNADQVSQMPLYTVNTATDLYRCFVIPSGNTSTEYITKIEVIPGNRNIVHHVLVYQDQSNTCINLDNNDPGPGYTWFGDVGSSTATLITGWVPGQGVYELPANMGIKLLANTNLIIQVHYPGGTFSAIDSTQVRFVFSSGAVREVMLSPVINHITSLTNGPLFIPADSVKTFYAQESATMNATIISAAPHMHLIGQSITNYAIDPNGDTIPLIRINNWDFHWQGSYMYRQPIHLPFGSDIYAYATYDNTVNNDQNPNNPPADVYAGEATVDEMMIVYYAYLQYQLGDENIIIDSTLIASQEESEFADLVKTPQLYEPYPVPAATGEALTVSYFLPHKTRMRIELVDATGRIVEIPADKETSAGFGTIRLNTNTLAKGTYFVRLTADGSVKTKAIVIR